MRFAYAGIDFMGQVFESFVAAGWTPVKLFTRPCDGVLDFNERIIRLASARKLPIQMSRMTPNDIAALDCDALVVAGYPWLIKGWEGRVPYAFNFHPSPLPEGRGPYPLFRAILENRASWGVAAHVLDPAFDTGAILGRVDFPLSADETHDTLLTKCQMACGRLARAIASDLPERWRNAEPQADAAYWHRTSDTERTIDFQAGVEAILRTVRAFGSIELLARFSGFQLHVSAAHGWIEAHEYTPGTLVHQYRRNLVVAAKDGFVQLTGWSPISKADARNLGR
jgi:methionyl-tRNA formyltransferase